MVRSPTLSVLLKCLPAFVLGTVGVMGLVHGKTSASSELPSVSNRPPVGSRLSERLAVREISVDQRREAQRLMHAFTLGQMTRHYWGGFATSLVDLGLGTPDSLEASVENSDSSTHLLIRPQMGNEVYVAGVARGEGRLATWACVGVGDVAPANLATECPEGWQSLRHARESIDESHWAE